MLWKINNTHTMTHQTKLNVTPTLCCPDFGYLMKTGIFNSATSGQDTIFVFELYAYLRMSHSVSGMVTTQRTRSERARITMK